jgi:hypothetical protein
VDSCDSGSEEEEKKKNKTKGVEDADERLWCCEVRRSGENDRVGKRTL